MKLFQKSSRALTGILAFSVFSFYSINSFGQFDTAPTYYDGVRDALIRNCAECHRDDAPNLGGISAPFSVFSYEQTKVWAPVIALRLKNGSMPPWGAHRQHQGTFKNERYISDFDKALIIFLYFLLHGGSPSGTIAPCNIILFLSGTMRSSSINIIVPKPSQC